MVTLEKAECPDKKWFDKDRCAQFTKCDESVDGKPCDFKNLNYDYESIKSRLDSERKEVMRFALEKKMAKKADDKKLMKEIDDKLIDKSIGIMIMQEAFMKDFGGKMSLNERIKAMREVRRWKKQLK